jgi:hypothetical protein
MLEHAEDYLESPSETIIIKSDSLDPAYVPAVEGTSFKHFSGSEIEALVDIQGPIEYVRLSEQYSWYRGPVTVQMSVHVHTAIVPKIEPIAGTPWSSRSMDSNRWVRFKCRRSPVGWSCEPT